MSIALAIFLNRLGLGITYDPDKKIIRIFKD